VSRAAAFFDMDRTVVRRNTAPLYLAFALRHGRLKRRHALVGAWWTVLYKLTLLDTESAMRRAIAAMTGDDAAALRAFGQEWFDRVVVREVSPTARRLVAAHRRRGDLVVLLTASTDFAAAPLAAHLEMDAALATRLEADAAGRLTGRPVEPPCLGAGKVVWAEHLAAERDVDLAASTFYTDSFEDRPMLERVGYPVIVNPDPRLARLARRTGWRVERWP
jgi:HAD superfamily hydrolase (TIGR01490 family)